MKTAFSLPAPLFRAAEAKRRKTGLSRSALYARALAAYLRADQVREHEARYEAGYRENPEEASELEAILKATAGTMGEGEW
jgi:hypothetical protein